MKFTEERLEQAIIELLEEEDCPRVLGRDIARDSAEVLIKEDLKTFLTRQYAIDNITSGEIKSIIRKMEVFAAELVYRRVDASLPLLGMQSFDKKSDMAVRKSDVSVAKNYLNENEMKLLGLTV